MVALPFPDVVAVLTRAPSAGGKSRLFSQLGIPPDRELLTALLRDSLDGASAPGVSVVVAVTPQTGCDEVAAAVPRFPVIPQSPGTLGDRMREIMRTLFELGAHRVALVGSDLPALTPDCITDAFAALDRDPGSLVLGPARDGGYYLIAAARVPDVFDAIEWGTSGVLAQTQARASRAGLRVHLLRELNDIDTVDDLRRIGQLAPQTRTGAWAKSLS